MEDVQLPPAAAAVHTAAASLPAGSATCFQLPAAESPPPPGSLLGSSAASDSRGASIAESPASLASIDSPAVISGGSGAYSTLNAARLASLQAADGNISAAHAQSSSIRRCRSMTSEVTADSLQDTAVVNDSVYGSEDSGDGNSSRSSFTPAMLPAAAAAGGTAVGTAARTASAAVVGTPTGLSGGGTAASGGTAVPLHPGGGSAGSRSGSASRPRDAGSSDDGLEVAPPPKRRRSSSSGDQGTAPTAISVVTGSAPHLAPSNVPPGTAALIAAAARMVAAALPAAAVPHSPQQQLGTSDRAPPELPAATSPAAPPLQRQAAGGSGTFLQGLPQPRRGRVAFLAPASGDAAPASGGNAAAAVHKSPGPSEAAASRTIREKQQSPLDSPENRTVIGHFGGRLITVRSRQSASDDISAPSSARTSADGGGANMTVAKARAPATVPSETAAAGEYQKNNNCF